MTSDPSRFGIDRNEELPDRVEHRRKIAERLALDSREYASDDPSRTAESAGIVPRARRSGLRSIVGSGPRTARNLDNREHTVCCEFWQTNRQHRRVHNT
jgi:hypothetical protein